MYSRRGIYKDRWLCPVRMKCIKNVNLKLYSKIIRIKDLWTALIFVWLKRGKKLLLEIKSILYQILKIPNCIKI